MAEDASALSFKINIIANYISNFYVTLIGIVMIPMYLRFMGPEAYGLVGFYTMLQAWFILLDFGLAPTMARETARFRGGATNAVDLRLLLRVLECIFVGVAVLSSTLMIFGSGAIAGNWLKVERLPISEVKHAIMLMSVIVSMRLVCGLYRGAINGFERLVWLGCFNTFVATARFIVVMPIFIYWGTRPTQFFLYQLVVAVAEMIFLVVKTYRLMPRSNKALWVPMDWRPLRGVLKFSLSIAFTGSIWVLVTQTDKLVLSKILPLADYAYFSLAVLVASGVLVVSGPISGALLPRITKMSAEGDVNGLILLYRQATQLMGIVAIPSALVLAFFAEQVLWAWTGDQEILSKGPPILALYALGNGILSLAAFPYYLQFAKGDLKLHLIGSSLFVVLLIPALLWATGEYGMAGAGYAWIATNALYFIFWVPIVHRHFVKGLHTQWLIKDVSMILIVSLVAASIAHVFVKWPPGRLQMALTVSGVGLAILITAATGSSFVRQTLICKWHARFGACA